jgi:hypothetical protein
MDDDSSSSGSGNSGSVLIVLTSKIEVMKECCNKEKLLTTTRIKYSRHL